MKLTSVRCSGIKRGYWTTAKKDDLVQRLGAIEYQGSRLLQDVCIKQCGEHGSKCMSKEHCGDCEIYMLARLVGTVE